MTDTAATRIPRPVPHTPSRHVRAALTWVAIFPLVTIGSLLLGPVSESWGPVLRALVLTAVVVSVAFYLVVPQLTRLYGAIAHRVLRRR